MKNLSPFDFTRHVSRPDQSGRSITTRFKNLCYGCNKPFNHKKGRSKITPVVFAGGKTGAFLCQRCTDDKEYISSNGSFL